MNNDISALRSHLFETLAALRDKTDPMDIDRAKAVCLVSEQIIGSAKTEIDFARVNGSVDSNFFTKPGLVPQIQNKPDVAGNTDEDESWDNKNGHVTVANGVTTHKMKI